MKKFLKEFLPFIAIGLLTIPFELAFSHFGLFSDNGFNGLLKPATVTESNSTLSTKNVELDYIEKNSKCSFWDCPSDKVLYFKGIKKPFMLVDDSQKGALELIQKLNQGTIVMSLYKYLGMDCVHSVKVINGDKEEMVFDYSSIYKNSFTDPQYHESCSKKNVGIE